ncbi:DUF4132 domain-containing protein [Micromonospora cabrerizensis]|uniref:DUF4132 domain-containing protein n=1 Tax=Micromonospora cabrerizensis TaxID=2911213 RepID=UPI00237802AB|nr:DUF4132 domain-containing protein [Micromonospora cabrerizensis]
MGWLAAGVDYEVSLERGKVIARNRQGRLLKSLPKALRDTDAVVGLRQLSEWLKRHEVSCRREVEQWMVRSLPVPTTVICEVWADEAWRTSLRDLVVVPIDDAGDGTPTAPGCCVTRTLRRVSVWWTWTARAAGSPPCRSSYRTRFACPT